MFKSDTITIVKPDGQRFENVKADVQPDTVFIDDGSLPLEEGDTILRELPNGLEERYTVVDRGYFSEGLGGGSGEYQAKVRKKSIPSDQGSSKVVYNVQGENARVNINSKDSSVNVVSVQEEQLFADLREVIQDQISNSEKTKQLLGRVEALENARGTEKFSQKYADFMSVIADHAQVSQALAPYLPALSQLLNS
jgi:hypothetical protein